jgi:hypothetical protein
MDHRQAAEGRHLNGRRNGKMMARWLMLMASALALPGCYDDDPCDPGQKLENGACVAVVEDVSEDSGASGAGGAGNSQAGGAGDNAGGAPAADFGDACSEHGDCADPVPYCALQPGQEIGYCTATGCNPPEDTDVCPDGWGCMDLSIFAAGEPVICTQP